MNQILQTKPLMSRDGVNFNLVIRLQTNSAFILGITKDATSSSIKLKVNVPFVTLGNCVDIYRPTGVTIKNKQV